MLFRSIGLTGEVFDRRPEFVSLVRFDAGRWKVLSRDLPKQHVRGRRIDAIALWAAVA